MLYIFDWDGTLCDSLDKIVYCTKAAARDLGIPEPSDESVRDIIGLSLMPAIQKVFPGITDNDLKALLKLYAQYFKDDDTGSPVLYEGAIETLAHIRDEGHQIAIATGKSRVGLDRVLGSLGLTGYFDGSRCADETASKPNPKMLQELLEEFDTAVTEAVMIGDTEYDMDMARQLDMQRIAVSYGAHEIHRLHPFEPVLCLDRIDELKSWDRGLFFNK